MPAPAEATSVEVVNLTLNGQEVQARPGQTILEVAREAGVDIPTLCHDPRLEPYGACRLCLVEVEGARGPMAACGAKVSEGMKVQTHTEKIVKLRKFVLELLLTNHPARLPRLRGGRRLPSAGLRLRVSGRHGSLGLAAPAGRRSRQPPQRRPFWRPLHPVRTLRAHLSRGHVHRLLGLPQPWLRQRGRHSLPPAAGRSGMRLVRAVRQHLSRGSRHRAARPSSGRVPGRPTRCAPSAPTARTGASFSSTATTAGVVRVQSELGKGLNQGNLCVRGRFGQGYVDAADRLLQPLMRDAAGRTPDRPPGTRPSHGSRARLRPRASKEAGRSPLCVGRT